MKSIIKRLPLLLLLTAWAMITAGASMATGDYAYGLIAFGACILFDLYRGN